ncbi:MAG: hypothetical protein GX595_08785, partial [Lentisphaerae bacterium]|nr:hypothetical protein [Lentisphaerota bacterium]
MRIAKGLLLVTAGLLGLWLAAGLPRQRGPSPQALMPPPVAAVNSPAAPARQRPAGAVPTPGTAETEAVEDLFICPLYSPDPDAKATIERFLFGLGARRSQGRCVYRHPGLSRPVVIHIVTDRAGFERALTTEGAHVILCSHANYGLGPAFATPGEMWSQTITDLRTIDDDRLFTCSSPWIGVNVLKMREKQKYPFWAPRYRDGASAVMPYTFGDPAGNPPYNYLLTYQVPGDPTRYPIEAAPDSFLERFPTTRRPAWNDPDGGTPDPANPAHRNYFITNDQQDFLCEGAWSAAFYDDEASDDDCLTAPAGDGTSTATWAFDIPHDGLYD